MHISFLKPYNFSIWDYWHSFSVLQPVGFVTFNTRAGAESAKQDLQVSKHGHHNIIYKYRQKFDSKAFEGKKTVSIPCVVNWPLQKEPKNVGNL